MFTYPIFGGALTALPTVESIAVNAFNASSYNVPLPADVQVGELLVIFLGYASATGGGAKRVTSAPAGWKVQMESMSGLGGAAFLWKIADGTEGATVALTFAYITFGVARSIRISGHSATQPIGQVNAWNSAGASSTSGSQPGPAPTAPNSLAFAMVSGHNASSTITPTGNVGSWTNYGQQTSSLSRSTMVKGDMTSRGYDGQISFSSVDLANNNWAMLNFTINPDGYEDAELYSGPTFAAIQRSSATGGPSQITCVAPAGITAGETLVIGIANDNGNSGPQINTPAGWTKIDEQGSSTSDSHAALFYKIASGSEGNVTVTGAVSGGWLGWYGRITGAHATTPLDSGGVLANSFYNSYANKTLGTMTAPSGTNMLNVCIMSARDSRAGNGDVWGLYIRPYDMATSDGASAAGTAGTFAIGESVEARGGPVHVMQDGSVIQGTAHVIATFKGP